MSLFPQDTLSQLVASHGYWSIALIVGLESMGIPLPGETMLVLAAIYAASDSTLNIWLVIAAAAFGSIIGDTTPATGSGTDTPMPSCCATGATWVSRTHASKLANTFFKSMGEKSSSWGGSSPSCASSLPSLPA